MKAKVKESAPHRLIVEGQDDQYSILSLTMRNGWDWDHPSPEFPFIANAGGLDNALEALKVSVRSYERVGIVLDADLDPANRWTAVRDRLINEGIVLPQSPDPNGTVVAQNGKYVGVWLMPDNVNPGKLEDFLGHLIPRGDQCWTYADEVTKKALVDHGAQFSDQVKARIHTWLAWRPTPGQPFGVAMTAAAFQHDAALAQCFVEWMARLYR